MNYCSQCGQSVSQKIPTGDNRLRYVCDSCETVHYQNPRIISGCLLTWEDRVLLCKRAIAPREGYWTLPAGFLENGETSAAGALRESQEEANATGEIEDLYTVFSLPHISQIYLFYRGRLLEPSFSAGEESLDVGLFTQSEIPWDELAFPVITRTLQHYFEDRLSGDFPIREAEIIVDRSRPPLT